MFLFTKQVATVLLLTATLGMCGCSSRKGSPEEPNLPKNFDGNSAQLENTVIVPTLDTPIPKGKNTIWCSSFQVAWNELKERIIGEPIRLDAGQEIAECLNGAKQTTQDLVPGSYYAAAGFVKDGITQTVQKEIAARFPQQPIPEFENLTDAGILSYSYLEANVRFQIPFFENQKEFIFTDSAGKKTKAGSFGIRPEDEYAYDKLRKQVEVLFVEHDQNEVRSRPRYFTLDLCKYSKPCQIIVAVIEPKPTLEEMLDDLKSKVAKYPKDRFTGRFGPNDTLLVPNMFWRITHHFEEVEGAGLLNSGYTLMYIQEAAQVIQFRLDRSGAELKSEARVLVSPMPTEFILDHSFLVCIKKRDATYPFFVMWMDNAELLAKPQRSAGQE